MSTAELAYKSCYFARDRTKWNKIVKEASDSKVHDDDDDDDDSEEGSCGIASYQLS